jgi:hypothetical protein
VVIDRFEGQSARSIFDLVESLAPPIEDVAKAEALMAAAKEGEEAAKEGEEAAKEGEEAAKEGEEKPAPAVDEEKIRLARLERIRNSTAAAKNIDTILSGPCQHMLCLEAKKACAAAAECCANADAKNAELKSFCESSVWKQAARTVEDEQVNRPRFCVENPVSPRFSSPPISSFAHDV